MTNPIINVVFAGLGGQGVLKASDILADAVVRAGFDVKKSEIHGMSQRGGSVTSDVRFGPQVFSPMVPVGEADFLIVLAAEEVNRNRGYLKPDGVLITADSVPAGLQFDARSLNVALLGVLSRYLTISVDHWQAAIQANLPEKAFAANMNVFNVAHSSAEQQSPGAP
jgi:indolepyruvate ferredoxin oxidoreductase beta subunit